MKSSELRLTLFLLVGLIMFVLPLAVFHFHEGGTGKLIALRSLAVSLSGLALIVLALSTLYFKRRAMRLEDTRA